MAYTELITLLNVQNVKTPTGSIEEKIINEKELLAEERSVSSKQFTELYSVGMKAERIFKITDYYDYDNEEYLIHNGKRYNILKQWRKNEEKELEISVGAIMNNGGEDYGSS